MATIVVTRRASSDLDTIARTHSLPASARMRVQRSIAPLAAFPLLGPALHGRWEGLRFLVGPWPWMLIVYQYVDELDLVTIVTLQDAREARSATSQR